MKSTTLILFLLSYLNLIGQKSSFQHLAFDGKIHTEKELNISLNFVVRADSTLVGSYFYETEYGTLKITGKLHHDNSFILYERDRNNCLTGKFEGRLIENNTQAIGLWTSPNEKQIYDFSLYPTRKINCIDFFEKNRKYYEYTSINSAIANSKKVKSIDVQNSGLHFLPKSLSKLTQIESINLLGNNFSKFPEVLTDLKTLDEISLSSNQLTTIPGSIRKLINLRVLIINFNELNSIPKEIGSLRNLLYLELGNNNLKTLPSEIRNLRQLQQLHLIGNQFPEHERVRIKKLLPNCIIRF